MIISLANLLVTMMVLQAGSNVSPRIRARSYYLIALSAPNDYKRSLDDAQSELIRTKRSFDLSRRYDTMDDMEEIEAKVEPWDPYEEEARVVEVTWEVGRRSGAPVISEDKRIDFPTRPSSSNRIEDLDLDKCSVKNERSVSSKHDVKEILNAGLWKKVKEGVINSTWKVEEPAESGENFILTYINDRVTFQEFVMEEFDATEENSRRDSIVLECYTEEVLDFANPKDMDILGGILADMKTIVKSDPGDVLETVITKRKFVTVEVVDDDGEREYLSNEVDNNAQI